MHPEIEELRTKLKEILYDCAVEIRATKAALYLADGDVHFQLVSEYGFRGTVRQTADRNDPMVDRCGRGRTSFFLNGLTADPRFSELLYESSTEHLLAAPIYSRGSLVGLIDMRDKAQKQPFEQTDIPKAQSIADRIAALFANKNVFGQRFISLSDATDLGETVAPNAPIHAPPHAHASAAPVRTAPPAVAAKPRAEAAAPSGPVEAVIRVPRLATLVQDARRSAARVIIPAPVQELGDAEMMAAREVLRSILLIPNAVAATFSAIGGAAAKQELVARAPLSEEGSNFLQSKLNIWLTKRGEAGGMPRTSVTSTGGPSAPPITPAQMQKVFTAPVVVASLSGLYLTVAFAEAPDRSGHELLAAILSQLQTAVEHSMRQDALKNVRIAIAQKLLEPEFSTYPQLAAHTRAVVKLTGDFAAFLSLGAAESETLQLVAMTHDAGMRMLDYDRLYAKKDLSEDEKAILREHVSVGAVIVDPLLGNEVGRAVLCHHERVDGLGYPNELRGEEIPFSARVLQICDAWAAMTDASSYRQTIGEKEAAAEIEAGAGTQFDGDLARRFLEMVRSGRR